MLVSSFNTDDSIIKGLPDDLDKETIVFSKMNYINETWTAWYDKEDLSYRQKDIESSWNDCVNRLKQYPFKYIIVDAKMTFCGKYAKTEMKLAEGEKNPEVDKAKYSFEYLPEYLYEDMGPPMWKPRLLAILDHTDGKYYSLRTQKKAITNVNSAATTDREMKKLIAEVRKKYKIK